MHAKLRDYQTEHKNFMATYSFLGYTLSPVPLAIPVALSGGYTMYGEVTEVKSDVSIGILFSLW